MIQSISRNPLSFSVSQKKIYFGSAHAVSKPIDQLVAEQVKFYDEQIVVPKDDKARANSKADRLEVFLKVLKELPAANDLNQAIDQVRESLSQVEDRFSEKVDEPKLFPGRIYLGKPVSLARDLSCILMKEDMIILIGSKGAIEIQELDQSITCRQDWYRDTNWKTRSEENEGQEHSIVLLSKSGIDGKSIWGQTLKPPTLDTVA